jgi:nicotinamidase-related amidase
MEETTPHVSPVADRDSSALIAIDFQDAFLSPIRDRAKVVQRARFIIEVANLLGVPVLATEQYPERMGETISDIRSLVKTPPIAKMCFSGCAAEGFSEQWQALERSQAILVGIETHICVSQTAHDFLANEIDVFVCSDGTGARPADAHEIGLQRLRSAGAVIAHTESIAYEWMREAGTDEFREMLKLVKQYLH